MQSRVYCRTRRCAVRSAAVADTNSKYNAVYTKGDDGKYTRNEEALTAASGA